MNLKAGYWRIYSATLINTFGSWCTFLALALLVKERFGAQFVPMVFLVQTLPVILFSRGMIKMIAPKAEAKWYVAIQIIFTLNSIALLVSTSFIVIFLHLFVAGLLKGLSGPLYNQLLSRWTVESDRKRVFTRVDALAAGALALAPAAGAWVKIFFSYEALFAIDAATFLFALVLLLPHLKGELRETHGWMHGAGLKWSNFLNQIVHQPNPLPVVLWLPLLLWLSYQIVGSLLNGLEFSTFSQQKMSDAQIGYALAAWGVGNLVTFLVGQVRVQLASGLYLSGLILFVFAPSWVGVIFSFLVAGFSYSALSGGLKNMLIKAVPEGFNPLPVWSYANQLTQFMNLLCYVSAGFILNSQHVWVLSALLLLVAGILWLGTFYEKRALSAQF